MSRGSERGRLAHALDVVRVLVGREFKSRYRKTSLGVAWSVLSPLLFLMTFYLVFKVVIDLQIERYASYIFIGIVAWTWFQGALGDSVIGISSNPGLVSQPGFPVFAVPIVSVTTALINFLTALPIVLVVLLFEGARPHLIWLTLPLLVFIQYVLTLGLSYLLAALNVHLRDTQYILPAVLQIGYFMSPIFYDASRAPKQFALLFNLNPMVHILGGYRDILLRGAAPNWGALGVVFVCSAALLWVGHAFFRRASYRFLEEL
ncbi:MAG: hypothetical protein BGN86_01100 [Caulobacterales bacterium 68-7]|nr:MAG: hypothetical protein BGN86_01100 [Caulobacterales bacterium 68-7]